ncbi:MAG TPA: type IV toxin-antitoxin system AbiEi family antitoxin domain-containing protein [Wenzhouxiangella sp.]|nr:type IV toxin-antitoxin system AbiEi family antitoxin domain-containing protein [Wenzhouxiangella sp.]
MSIMNGQKPDSLKRLLQSVPPGFVVDSPWLRANRIGRRSVYEYVKRGWLDRPASGVYRRPLPGRRTSDRVDWRRCVLSMQHIMGYAVHVGAMSALALHGHSHYLPLGEKILWLYGSGFPGWLTRLPLDVALETRSTSLFSDPGIGLMQEQAGQGSVVPAQDWALKVSTPERAVLEALDELPDHESFHSLEMVFEGLATLRPRLLASLLENCTSIKVKRLFFVFADYHDHAWRALLDPDSFYLGRGDRGLLKGGRIHPRYRIVVPEMYAQPRSGSRNRFV